MSEVSDWQSMDTAPCDGTEIEGEYEDGPCLIMWSERPVCMLGQRNGGFPEGWATAYSGGTDANLPMDEPTRWRINHDI